MERSRCFTNMQGPGHQRCETQTLGISPRHPSGKIRDLFVLDLKSKDAFSLPERVMSVSGEEAVGKIQPSLSDQSADSRAHAGPGSVPRGAPRPLGEGGPWEGRRGGPERFPHVASSPATQGPQKPGGSPPLLTPGASVGAGQEEEGRGRGRPGFASLQSRQARGGVRLVSLFTRRALSRGHDAPWFSPEVF